MVSFNYKSLNLNGQIIDNSHRGQRVSEKESIKQKDTFIFASRTTTNIRESNKIEFFSRRAWYTPLASSNSIFFPRYTYTYNKS